MNHDILIGHPLVPYWATHLMVQRNTVHLAWAINEKLIVTFHIVKGRVEFADPPTELEEKEYEGYLAGEFNCSCIPNVVQLENE